MPKYLCQGSYTEAGLKGLLKEGGSKRRAMVEQLVRNMGVNWKPFISLSAATSFTSSSTCPATWR